MNSENEEISVDKAMQLYQSAVTDAATAAQIQDEAVASSELVISSVSPEMVKKRLIDSRLALNNAQKVVKEAKKNLDETLKKQLALVANMELVLAPLKKQMARIVDGIDAMNLYMGRDEFIYTIREGEKAPKDSPIVIRQRVLAMDEETAIDALDGGIDAMDIEKFDEWLLADPAHVQQVIPEEKSVVVLKVRASRKDYGDPWKNLVMDELNKETWWLIRNGENLYRMVTEFEVGINLVPKSEEFTDIFISKEWFGSPRSPLKPGTSEWLKAEQVADARTRHYMKIALILQGLIDRTEVFRPLPIEGLSVIEEQYYENGFVEVVADSDNAIENTMQPFRDWLREKNANLGIGTRLILSTVQHNSKGSYRISPPYASPPKIHTPHVIKRSTEDSWAITYPRVDTVWDENERQYREARTSGTYRLYKGDSDHIALDFVDIKDMEGYLTSRSQRHNYENMFPVLRAAIAFKKAENEQEAPFRALLASELDKAGYNDDATELVHWWKTANKWNRPLMGSQEDEAKAARAILSEAKRRNSGSDDESVAKSLLAVYPDAMAILRGNSNYVVLIPEAFSVKPAGSTGDVFLRRLDITKTGVVKSDKRWTVLSKAQYAKMTVIISTPKWEHWNIGADPNKYLTEPDFINVFDEAKSYVEKKYGEQIMAFVEESKYDSPKFKFLGVHADVDIDTPLSLTKWVEPLTTSEVSVYILKSKGVVSISTHYASVSPRYWRPNHNDIINPTKDSGAYKTPWDEFASDSRVWINEEKVLTEVEFSEKYRKFKIDLSFLDAEADMLIDGIVKSWHTAYETKMYSRYMEDFADDEGWEEYKDKKKLLTKFPYSNSIEKFSYNRQRTNNKSTLRWLVKRLVETQNAPYGLTVAEAYRSAQLVLSDVHDVELPDDIKDLKFLDKLSENMENYSE